jgi:DsbC/DsbD-like thiol-disulfide interchange protein
MDGRSGMRLLFAAFALLAFDAFAAPADDDDHVRVSLVSEQTALVPGTTAWLGLRLMHAPHWHTYWVNPGDSGLPTTLSWTLPDGFRAAAVAWPTPRRIDVGELANFGYTGDIVLPVQIDVPDSATDGTTARIAVDAKWLVCQEECIPGKASLAIDLPIRSISASDANVEKLFTTARNTMPRHPQWAGVAHVDGDRVDVTLHTTALSNAKSLDAFAIDRRIVANAPPKITKHAGDITLTFKKSDYFTATPTQFAVLVQADAQAWTVTVPFDATNASPKREVSP